MDNGVIVAIVAAVGAIIGGVITAMAGLVPAILRKESAISEAWEPLAQAQQAHYKELSDENAELRGRLEALEERDRAREKAHDTIREEFEALEARSAWQAGEIERLTKRLNAQTAMHSASMEALRNELELERSERKRLERWVERLVAQLQENGIRPVPKPD